MKIAIVIALVLTIGCGGSFKTQQINTPNTEQAYRTAMQSMAAHGQAIETHDEASGLVLGAWSANAMSGSEFRIRVAVGSWTTVSVDCRMKSALDGSWKDCGGGDGAPSDVADAASAIARDLGGN